MPAGIILSGNFIGSDWVKGKDDKQQLVCAVSVGINSYKCYMSEVPDQLPAFGEEILIRCRCYAGRNGVMFVDGEIVA